MAKELDPEYSCISKSSLASNGIKRYGFRIFQRQRLQTMQHDIDSEFTGSEANCVEKNLH